MKNAEPSVRKHSIAEHVEQLASNVAEEVTGLYANTHHDLERHVLWTINLEILAGHAKTFHAVSQSRLEWTINLLALQAIDREEHRVPTAGPTGGGCRALHVDVARLCNLGTRRDFLVISRSDRTFLLAKSAGRALSDLFDRLGVETAQRGKKVRHAVFFHGFGGDDVGERVCADVAGSAVANAVSGEQFGSGRGSHAELAIAKTKIRSTVRFNFDDESLVLRVTVEQIATCFPNAFDTRLAQSHCGRGQTRRIVGRQRRRCFRRSWELVGVVGCALRDRRVF